MNVRTPTAGRSPRLTPTLCTMLSACGAAASLFATGCMTPMSEPAISVDFDKGGQTGSLVPTCDEEARATLVVPEGQTAFAQRWNEPSNPVLTDADGNVVQTSLSEEGETTLIRTPSPLTPGDYTLTYDCGNERARVTRELSVSDVAPAPTAFGGLALSNREYDVECSDLEFVTLEWTPPSEFLPYLDLVRLTISVDGSEFEPVVLAQPLVSDLQGTIRIDIPHCAYYDDHCGSTSGAYVVGATIAGTSGKWSSEELFVDAACYVADETPEDDGCALGNHKRSGWTALAWLVIGPLVVRRRARRRGHDEPLG